MGNGIEIILYIKKFYPDDIITKLRINIIKLTDKRKEYKNKWKELVKKINEDHISKQILNFNPRCKRNVGRLKMKMGCTVYLE